MQKYDILLIQEIRDASETVPDTLVDAVNADIGYVTNIWQINKVSHPNQHSPFSFLVWAELLEITSYFRRSAF